MCVSSIGCLRGHVKLYDSLYDDVISQEIEQQTNEYARGQISVTCPLLQFNSKVNGSNCGIFAIAFAACLVFGEDPSHVNFHVPRMRPHLATCLKNCKIVCFHHINFAFITLRAQGFLSVPKEL